MNARSSSASGRRCQHNYGTTDETYELENIQDVFGHVHARWFLVKWKGHQKPEWEREHLLIRDDCGDSIKEFWVSTGKNPSKKFYKDPHGQHRCTVCAKQYKRAQDLKAHRTREGHHDEKTHRVTETAKKDAKLEKRKEMQKLLPKAKWGDQEADNAWHTKYLGSIFEAGGGMMADVRRRIAMARQRFGKMHHLWKDNNLHRKLRLRLYKAAVCSILTYGSEVWTLSVDVRKAINGANAAILSIITGRTPHEEATRGQQTFDLVKWVRARRLQWLGHILRMGPERLLKRAVFEMFKTPQDGDLLMDAPNLQTGSWRELCTLAYNRDFRRTRVGTMKQPEYK